MDLDGAKENIQPLAGGRDAKRLEVVLSAKNDHEIQTELLYQRQELEAEIASYKGDDPLELWFEYICWIEQSYPSGGKENGLNEVLLNCLRKFENNERYRQDRRLIKLYIKYIDSQPNPQEYYLELYNNGIGTMVADLYICWALYYDLSGNFQKANAIFQKGLNARAQPLDELEQAHRHFGFTMSQRILNQDEDSQTNFITSLMERRHALTSLKPKKKNIGSIRTGTAIKSYNPGRLEIGEKQSLSNAKVKVPVFCDENQNPDLVTNFAALSEDKTGAQSVIGSIIDEVRKRENIREPGPWSKAKIHHKGLLFSENENTGLSFTILEDVQMIPLPQGENKYEQGIYLPHNHFQANLPQKQWELPLTVEDDVSSYVYPCYDKFHLYPRVDKEYSPEELYAYRWFKKNKKENAYVQQKNAIWSNDYDTDIRLFPQFVKINLPQEKFDTKRFINDESFQTGEYKLKFCFNEVYPADAGEEYQFEEILMKRIRKGTRKIKFSLDDTILMAGDMEETKCSFNPRQSIFSHRFSILPQNSDSNNLVIRKTINFPEMQNNDDKRKNSAINNLRIKEAVNLSEIDDKPTNSDNINLGIREIVSLSGIRDDRSKNSGSNNLEIRKILNFPEIEDNIDDKSTNSDSNNFGVRNIVNFSEIQKVVSDKPTNSAGDNFEIRERVSVPEIQNDKNNCVYNSAIQKSQFCPDVENPKKIANNYFETGKSIVFPGVADDNKRSSCVDIFGSRKSTISSKISTSTDDRENKIFGKSESKIDDSMHRLLKMTQIPVNISKGAREDIFSSMIDKQESLNANSSKDRNNKRHNAESVLLKDNMTAKESSINEQNNNDCDEALEKIENFDINEDIVAKNFGQLPCFNATRNHGTNTKVVKESLPENLNDTCSTQAFNFYINAAAISTPKSKIKTCEKAQLVVETVPNIAPQANSLNNSSPIIEFQKQLSTIIETSETHAGSSVTTNTHSSGKQFIDQQLNGQNINQENDLVMKLNSELEGTLFANKKFKPLGAVPKVLFNSNKAQKNEMSSQEEHENNELSALLKSVKIFEDKTDTIPKMLLVKPQKDIDYICSLFTKSPERKHTKKFELSPQKNFFGDDSVPFSTSKILARPVKTQKDAENSDDSIEIVSKEEIYDKPKGSAKISRTNESVIPVFEDLNTENVRAGNDKEIECFQFQDINDGKTSVNLTVTDCNLHHFGVSPKSDYEENVKFEEKSLHIYDGTIISRSEETSVMSDEEKMLERLSQISIYKDVRESPINENEYQINSGENNENIVEELNNDFDDNINPFHKALQTSFLEQLEFRDYISHLSSCAYAHIIHTLKKGDTIKINDNEFDVLKYITRGAFGMVFCGKSRTTGKLYAIKQEQKTNLWEYYICLKVHALLTSEDIRPGFMNVEYALIGDNSNLLLSELSKYGSLLAISNEFRKSKGKLLDEYIVMIIANQILLIIDHLHALNIIHTDIKPDNFLLMSGLSYDKCMPPSVQLIDFGMAIDMSLFPPNQVFRKIAKVTEIMCTENIDNRPWTYQVDLFGVAGTIHVLLFGSYMDIEKKGMKWFIKTHVPRYFNKFVWSTMFDELLNIEDCNKLPNLQGLRSILTEAIVEKEKYVRDKIREFNLQFSFNC